MDELMLTQSIMKIMQNDIDYDTFKRNVDNFMPHNDKNDIVYVRALRKCKELCNNLIDVAEDNDFVQSCNKGISYIDKYTDELLSRYHWQIHAVAIN